MCIKKIFTSTNMAIFNFALDYVIYSCGLGCGQKAKHFHCCQCPQIYINKAAIFSFCGQNVDIYPVDSHAIVTWLPPICAHPMDHLPVRITDICNVFKY